jgi:glycosyltransferase involved in cell wall biosynthesis
MKIACLIAYERRPQRHGGVKRSSQLIEATSELGIASHSIRNLKGNVLSAAISSPLQFLRFLVQAFLLVTRRGTSIPGALKFVAQAALLHNKLMKLGVEAAIVETWAGQGILTMLTLKCIKLPYVAMPQNIESMVPGKADKTFRNGAFALTSEIRGYANAQAVVTISRFDAAVLETLGVSAAVYGYYPEKSDVNSLRQISDARRLSKKSHFLMLGTIKNAPTLQGMIALLDQLHFAPLADQLLIAGYGTESLRNYNSARINVVGSVSDEELYSLFKSCKALVISQTQTTGFLTRIVECNLASIPVYILGNYLQADGLEDYGVHQISSIDSLPANPNGEFKRFERPSLSILRTAAAALQTSPMVNTGSREL